MPRMARGRPTNRPTDQPSDQPSHLRLFASLHPRTFSALSTPTTGGYDVILPTTTLGYGDILPERFEESVLCALWSTFSPPSPLLHRHPPGAPRGVHLWLPLHRPCVPRGVYVRHTLPCVALLITCALRGVHRLCISPRPLSTSAPPASTGAPCGASRSTDHITFSCSLMMRLFSQLTFTEISASTSHLASREGPRVWCTRISLLTWEVMSCIIPHCH